MCIYNNISCVAMQRKGFKPLSSPYRMGKGVRKAMKCSRAMPFRQVADEARAKATASSWKDKQRQWTMAGLRAMKAPMATA